MLKRFRSERRGLSVPSYPPMDPMPPVYVCHPFLGSWVSGRLIAIPRKVIKRVRASIHHLPAL